ncbi:MAG: glycosyltransferase, partial [Bacteroidota bacterium]|nr:glycosyltransferase [Bacteroidota bacterium]
MKSLVIIPTYNEIENIKKIVISVLDKKDNFDVLIVDDSSPDGTSKVVEDVKKDYENRLHLMIRKGK